MLSPYPLANGVVISRILPRRLDMHCRRHSGHQPHAWRTWITDSLRALAEGRTVLANRPTGGETDTLRRIARQIELMAGAMERLPG